MKTKIILGLALVLSLAACGQEKKNSFAYDYDDNGCRTGSHAFGSMTEYCEALRDDTLNNSCAYSLRKAAYTANCGSDWAFAPQGFDFQ